MAAAEPLMASPGALERASEAICRIAAARNEGEVVGLLSDASHRLGADVALFCSCLQAKGVPLRFMLACDPRWYLEYERFINWSQDPWVLYAAESAEPVCASRLMVTSQAGSQALALARRYGFESAFVVPSPAGRGEARWGVLVLGSRTDGFFESAGCIALKVMARSLSMELHEWCLSHARRDFLSRAQLSSRDIDLLRREHRGYSTKEIARQLHVTVQSVDSRFQRLNARLGVSSRKAAASLAVTYGLI
ncbi:LuxR C-terminal-related transcriptional regulator [Piscinibacter sp. XHJ-5]|uniref:helix-turn-helix transcriptional regulator n=1 Tax=Piscinibacter sp. XHJ-5 TaxID=3037797 RepID=UPI002452E4B5|nr:LuxR C-terminal-related transcriptional regulator [Piscinibacter sp. XHJ-5]